MRSKRILSLAVSLAISVGAVTLIAQVPVTPTPPGERTPAQLKLLPKALATASLIKSQVVPDFMKMPPNMYMGEGIGVDINSKGLIYVNTCAQQTRTMEFDKNGNYIREIGKDSYGHVF